MKKSLLFLALLQFPLLLKAQTFAGLWEGKMNAGVEIRMIFHITQDASGNFSVTIDCPDQGLKDLKPGSLYVSRDTLRLTLDQFQASYSGTLSNDTLIAGTFKQGVSLPLNLKKVKTIARKKRPQTPVGPFPYESKDLLYTNSDKTITYGATITIPRGKGPFPAALLLTGSGQQNRDEEILEHRPFAVLADHLSRHGFIVLRVDDRGVGQSTGNPSTSTTLDFARDAAVSLEYLIRYEKVDKKKAGLIGHSEGGMIAQILAADRKDINFVVMLAGPGEKTRKLMHDQNEALLTEAGLPKDYVSSYLTLYNSVVTTILASDQASATDKVKAVVDEWVAKTPEAAVRVTTGITDERTKDNFINRFVQQVGSPWFRYFLTYDPTPYIIKMTADVLALNGSKDVQVISEPNLAGIEASLKKSKSNRYEVKELAGLNHLFQECKSCTINEYDQLEQTISPAVLDLITSWLLTK